MQDEREILQEWVRRLLDGFGLPPLEVDVDAVLHLAAEAANGVIHAAAPLAAFIAGYAAGQEASSDRDPESSMRSAIELATRLAEANQT